jgi:hypothetical protein
MRSEVTMAGDALKRQEDSALDQTLGRDRSAAAAAA